MTLAFVRARLSRPVITAAVIGTMVGALVGVSYQAASPGGLSADPGTCHVGPAAGTYTCSVIVDPSAAPSPSATATPAPTVTPAPTPTVTPTPVASFTSGPIVVTASNTTINGAVISSTGTTGTGISATGTAAKPIDHLTIENCSISGFNVGIYLSYVTNVTIQNCRISGAFYAGILIFSGIGGTITGNTVSLIGPQSQAASNANGPDDNAYGIALTRSATSNFTTDPRSANWQVTNNTVTDVPAWHCYDTHAGQNIVFDHDTALRCMRAVFITTDSINTPALNVTFSDGILQQPKSYPIGGTPNTSLGSITLFMLQGGTFANNTISQGYGYCPSGVYDYTGKSTAYTVTGTVCTNP